MTEIPCRITDPDLFFSELDSDKTIAKELCEICPGKDKCLSIAIENKEVHGIWGGVDFTTYKHDVQPGMCRKGLHPKAYKGKCLPCRKDSQRAYDQRKYATERRVYKKNPHKRKTYGDKCFSGDHTLTPETTKIRSYDGAIMCIPCIRRHRPTNMSMKIDRSKF